MEKLKAIDISKELMRLYSNQNYKLLNTYVFRWESDFFCVSGSNYITEVEVKISRGDFKNDYKKTILSGINKHEYLVDSNYIMKPNKFIFACPKGLIQPEELNDKYGLIWFDRPNKHSLYTPNYIKKNPKFLHKENLMDNKIILKQLMNKYYYRNIELRHAMGLRQTDIKHNQKRLYESKLF